MAIAEHHPEMLYARNRGLLKMAKSELHDFASTKESKLAKSADKYLKKRRGDTKKRKRKKRGKKK
jgi:hypothetical protein